MALITELPANLAAAALVATTGSLLRRRRRGVAVDDAVGRRLRHSVQRRQLPQRRLARQYPATSRPMVAGERLLERAGFWSNHLLAMCRFTSDQARPAPEWFGDDGADTDALSEVLLDDQAWPALRIPFQGGHSAVVVYRNLIGDFGIDYLLTQPDWPRAKDLSSYDGDWYGPGLSWRDIVRIAETPDLAAPGVHDTAARLLLLLPMLADDELPPEAQARMKAALTAIGAPDDSAQDVADHLLRNRRPAAGRRGGADSPLSGGSRRHAELGSDESAVLWALNLTRTQSDALADALGSRPLPMPTS